jgi:hypothetical protein
MPIIKLSGGQVKSVLGDNYLDIGSELFIVICNRVSGGIAQGCGFQEEVFGAGGMIE